MIDIYKSPSENASVLFANATPTIPLSINPVLSVPVIRSAVYNILPTKLLSVTSTNQNVFSYTADNDYYIYSISLVPSVSNSAVINLNIQYANSNIGSSNNQFVLAVSTNFSFAQHFLPELSLGQTINIFANSTATGYMQVLITLILKSSVV